MANAMVTRGKLKQKCFLQPDRLNKRTLKGDVIVRTHDESVRGRSEEVDPLKNEINRHG